MTNGLDTQLTNPVHVTDNSDYSVTFSVTGLSRNRFIVSYIFNSYNKDPGKNNIGCSFLKVNDNHDQLKVESVSDLGNAAPDGYIKSVLLSSDTAIIAYSDANFQYGIRATFVSISSSPSGIESIKYGSSFGFTNGYTLSETVYGNFMDFDITVFDIYENYKSLLVFYPDARNGGRFSISAAKVTLPLPSLNIPIPL